MTPADQEFLRERGEPGDCWRACLASILDLPIAQVPHIILEAYLAAGVPADRIYEMPPENLDWWGPTTAFVRAQGFDIELVRPNYEEGHGWVECFASLRQDGHRYVILTGKSLRGVYHSVIWDLDRDELAHDPHPSRAGLLSGEWLDVAYLTRESAVQKSA